MLQRLYKSGKNDDMHKYTLHSDDPDFVRAKVNAQQISDVSELSSVLDTSIAFKSTWKDNFVSNFVFKILFP